MTNTVYATFIDPEMAKKAAGALLDHGVRSEHISIVFPEGYIANEDGKVVTENQIEDKAEKGITTTTAGDAASGAAKGAGFGLAAGALAALASVFIPGVGLVIGGGALAIAIGGAAGATAAGAVAGGVTGYLKDQGVPDAAVADYGRVLSSGGALISVFPTDEKVDTATIESVLTKYDGSVSLHASRATALTY
jgi:hypothetical protein